VAWRELEATLDFADSFFEEHGALFVRSVLDFNRTGPVVEGSEHFGLHVAHMFNQLVA
jgi:hypothetical protein